MIANPTLSNDRRLVLWLVSRMGVVQLFALLLGGAAGAGALLEWSTGMQNGVLAALDGVSGVWPKTGAAFLLIALALFGLRLRGQRLIIKVLAVGMALTVILMGVVSIAEWVVGHPIAIDRWLVAHSNNPANWQIPILTAAVMVFFGMAIIALVRQQITMAQSIGGGILLMGVVVYTAYAFGISTFYQPQLLGPTAPAMMGVIMALGIGLLCANPRQGFTKLWTAPGAGGKVARRLIPAAVLVPGLLMGLLLTGLRLGWLDDSVAVILLATMTVAVELAIFWRMANRLERVDGDREIAATELQLVNLALEEKVELRTAELEKARARMANIVESADALLGVDEQGVIVLANRRAQRLLDQTEHELLGKNIETVVRQTGWEDQVRLMKGEVNPGDECFWPLRESVEVEAVRDGATFPVEITVNPVEVEEGVMVLIAVRDISQRKEAELARQAQQEEAERSNQELEQFARAASHDLKEPLRMVQGYVQLLKRRYHGQLDADADEFIDLAVDGAERMRCLIDDILQYSKIRLEPKAAEPCAASEAVERALYNLRAAVNESDAVVEIGELPSLQVESSQLTMLMQNLIGNALKYQNKEVRPHIKVSAKPEDGGWRIEVADNGIGIEEQYFEKVFGLFQRLHTRGEYSGTGVGLALCGRIVEYAGGKIGVTSTLGGGSTFWFWLPAVVEVNPEGDNQPVELVLIGQRTPAPKVVFDLAARLRGEVR